MYSRKIHPIAVLKPDIRIGDYFITQSVMMIGVSFDGIDQKSILLSLMTFVALSCHLFLRLIRR